MVLFVFTEGSDLQISQTEIASLGQTAGSVNAVQAMCNSAAIKKKLLFSTFLQATNSHVF